MNSFLALRGPGLRVRAEEAEGDEASTTPHSLISFPEGRAVFSIIKYAFFARSFPPDFILVLFPGNLGPIYALSSIISPSASQQLAINAL